MPSVFSIKTAGIVQVGIIYQGERFLQRKILPEIGENGRRSANSTLAPSGRRFAYKYKPLIDTHFFQNIENRRISRDYPCQKYRVRLIDFRIREVLDLHFKEPVA